MSWLLWLVLGLALLTLEALTPGGPFILFFGLGALIVGVATSLGLTPVPWAQWALFSVASVVSVVILRKPLRARFNLDGLAKDVDSIVGTEAVLLEELVPGGVAKAELRGSSWNARSASGAIFPKGKRCRVERVDGLTLWLIAE